MKTRTLVMTYCLVIAFVFMGVYLSESATNQLRGIGSSPLLASVTPRDGGAFQLQILGKEWLVDPVAIRTAVQGFITEIGDLVELRLTEIMAR
ncbi:MAG: hypothetical protein ACM3ZQ_09655 [Bacillota bacterium]